MDTGVYLRTIAHPSVAKNDVCSHMLVRLSMTAFGLPGTATHVSRRNHDNSHAWAEQHVLAEPAGANGGRGHAEMGATTQAVLEDEPETLETLLDRVTAQAEVERAVRRAIQRYEERLRQQPAWPRFQYGGGGAGPSGSTTGQGDGAAAMARRRRGKRPLEEGDGTLRGRQDRLAWDTEFNGSMGR